MNTPTTPTGGSLARRPATIVKMARLTNSRNGSPRYRLTTDAGTQVETAPDTADSHGWSPFTLTDRPVILTLDGKGRVIGIEPVTMQPGATWVTGTKTL